jgi:hypothetical protein
MRRVYFAYREAAIAWNSSCGINGDTAMGVLVKVKMYEKTM